MHDITMAPLEGLGNHIYRNAFAAHYGGVSRYFTPFIDVSSTGEIKRRNLRDVLPEENSGLTIVPQILTSSAEGFLIASAKIADLGYSEININMGCPYPTVVRKGKGAAMLEDTERLRSFLDEVFSKSRVDLSIKMRAGFSDVSEAEKLIKIMNDYPVCELTIHPRLQREFYTGGIHEELLRPMVDQSRAPVCLNPSITTVDEARYFEQAYPDMSGLMIGRGLLACPELAEMIGDNAANELDSTVAHPYGSYSETAVGTLGTSLPPMKYEEAFEYSHITDMSRFCDFHDELLESYRRELSGDTQVLFKMKELWEYWQHGLDADPKTVKKIKKAQHMEEYISLAQSALK